MESRDIIDLAIAYAPTVNTIVGLFTWWRFCILAKKYFPFIKHCYRFINTDCSIL